MDKKRLDEIREFSKKNGEKYGISGEMDFSVDFVMWDEDGESYEIVVPDMWLDSTGRFKLKDEDLVEEWGLENVVNFINECDKYLREKKKMWIDLRVGETGRFVVENCSDEMLVGSEVCVNINKNWEIVKRKF